MSRRDRGLDIVLNEIASRHGLEFKTVDSVFVDLYAKRLIDRKRADELFEELGAEDPFGINYYEDPY